jgi:hypothetical protein
MNLKEYVCVALAMGLSGAAGVYYGRQQRQPVEQPEPAPAQPEHRVAADDGHQSSVKAAGDAAPAAPEASHGLRKSARATGANVFDENEVDAATAKLDDLLDDEDYDALLAEAKNLLQHPNSEVRSRVAFALQWAGLKGLDTLTAMLADPDPDIVREAFDYWKTAVTDISSDDAKAALLDAAYTTTGDSTDKSVLEDIVHEISLLENEFLAVEHLIQMANESKNKEHVSMFIEALDGFSQPENDSVSLKEAVDNVNFWKREKEAEEAQHIVTPGEVAGREPVRGQSKAAATAAAAAAPAAAPVSDAAAAMP